MKIRSEDLPVAVIGAGPVGLAAAAHFVQRGLTFIVLEASASVGASFDSVRHIRLFSPWRINVDRAGRDLLHSRDWREPEADALPTAGEMLDDYLLPLSQLPEIAPHIRLNHRVTQITRQGFDKKKTAGRDDAPFLLRVDTLGIEREVLARAVIDASGTWLDPNPLGANGLPAIDEKTFSTRITYGMPDILGRERSRYAGKRVLVIGAGHSAAGSLLSLAELAEQIPSTTALWAVRGTNLNRTFGGGEADGLPARGALGVRLKNLQASGRLEVWTAFHVHSVQAQQQNIRVIGEPVGGETPVINNIDEIICATGSRPDLIMTRELRLALDPWLESPEALAPLIDPNVHSCGTVPPHGHAELAHPEVGYYAVGAKSYGRASNFLMVTGYEQVRSVVAAIAGDMAAANDVQLVLPETGVCSTDLASACCEGPAPQQTDACCTKDAEEKVKGQAGCGCPTETTEARPTSRYLHS
jgi:hypothetical protein